MRVLAWDETGNKLALHDVFHGDAVDWKQCGSRGTMRCRVIGGNDAAGKLLIEPQWHAGVAMRKRWIKAIVERVYAPDGQRRPPAHPHQ